MRYVSKDPRECLLYIEDKRQGQKSKRMSSSIPLSFDLERRQLQHEESGSYKACLLLHAFAAAITSATNLIYRTLWKCYLDDGRIHWKSMEGDFIPKLKLPFNSQRKHHTEKGTHSQTQTHTHTNAHMHTCTLTRTHIATSFILINIFLSNNYKTQLSQIKLLLKI